MRASTAPVSTITSPSRSVGASKRSITAKSVVKSHQTLELAPPRRHLAEISIARASVMTPPERAKASLTPSVTPLVMTLSACAIAGTYAVVRASDAARRASDAWAAAASDASSAAREIEKLAVVATTELPSTLDAMEQSACEVELLASETREILARLDGTEYVENLKAEIEARMKDPTKDFRDLSDDLSEYVTKMTRELGQVMSTVGIYLDDGTFDDDVKEMSTEERLIRRKSINEAVAAAKETTENAAALTTRLQEGAKTQGRDLAEIVGKIALASEEVSKAMNRLGEATSGQTGFGREREKK